METKLQPSISYLRIFATLAVVWHHTCGTLIDNLDVFELYPNQVCFYEASRQTVSWDVPVFFMITGALLLDPEKKVTAEQCLKKYTIRILLALLIFGVPYALVKLVIEKKIQSVAQLICFSLKAVIENTGSAHLWYLYVLIGIYLTLPILRSFVRQANKPDTKLVIVVLAIVEFLFPIVENVFNMKIAFELPMTYPVFYVLIGYYIFIHRKELKKYRKLSWLIISLISLIIWIFNYVMNDSKILMGYNNPIIALLAISVFFLFVTREWKFNDKVWHVDRLCFGVYIIHVVCIQLCYRGIKVTPVDFQLWPVATVIFFATFAICSFILARMMYSIRPFKEYVL